MSSGFYEDVSIQLHVKVLNSCFLPLLVLTVNYNGQNVPMILVEQASLVSAFPYATEDPVYTPPTENSTSPPGESRIVTKMVVSGKRG